MKNSAGRFLDIREWIPPIIFLKACQAFRAMKNGETIEILMSETGAGEGLFKILPVSSYDIVNVLEEESLYRIILKKGQKRR